MCLFHLVQILSFIDWTFTVRRRGLCHNMFNQCSIILHTVMQQCGKNVYGMPIIQYLRNILR